MGEEIPCPMPSPFDRSPFNRPRWTEQDAREVLAALRRSGKAVRAFAAEHGIDAQRVYLWRRRLGEAERTTFQELMVRAAAGRTGPEAAGDSFAIVLASGDEVRVPQSFDGAALARLLEVLAQVRGC
jgi:transposase-like protein